VRDAGRQRRKDRECSSLLSSSPEIIRRAVTKWNVPRVATVPARYALVDMTTELRERRMRKLFQPSRYAAKLLRGDFVK